jgi:thiamine biosynthesis lipoprotein
VSGSVSVRTEVVMGTVVTIEVVRPGADDAIARAFEWFYQIEACCTRFDEQSELMQLTSQIGVAVPASAILYEAVHFALHVAEETGGAFDPTVGHRLLERGFNREHRTGRIVRTAIAPDGDVSYRDVLLDPARRTITLVRPLMLDLGAVAKGLAVDAAARELAAFVDFGIDAGGDLYLGGHNPKGAQWSVGIRHPRIDGALVDYLLVSDKAVCTSGDYERPAPGGGAGHHILDVRANTSPSATASVTVVAPSAMLADAVSTAAFVLGPEEGIRLFERLGVDGLILTPELERFQTPGLGHE